MKVSSLKDTGTLDSLTFKQSSNDLGAAECKYNTSSRSSSGNPITNTRHMGDDNHQQNFHLLHHLC